jgi:hypothetical protein
MTGKNSWHGGGGSSVVYGLGLIGALVYYLSRAATFGAWVIGFLKALVWPAFLVYHLLKFLKM